MSRTLDSFLRSVNLRLDLPHAERFAHFRPTRKSAQVTDAIARGEPSAASMAVAAYGSGKSIAAGAGALMLENNLDARGVIETLAARLDGVDPATAKFARNRVTEDRRGAALVLDGGQDDPLAALIGVAESKLGTLTLAKKRRGEPIAVLDAIAKAARKEGHDRIAIIWDEFGRYLEGLATDGRPEELSVVQQIAEWAVRQEAPAATFTLLLHQNFFHYAGALSQSARNAWRKIEGRFEPVRFVDDSREMHELIAWIVSRSRHHRIETPSRPSVENAAARARQLGFFDGFEDESALTDTLERAYPLTPAALHILPRLAARMAQNERTIFSFLNDTDFSGPVTLRQLFDGFAEAMQADTGAGGAHRRWLEAQTALSKAESRLEEEAITAAALLALGQAGQRLRLSMGGLLFALDPYGEYTDGEIREAVDRLIERKLLLHRERTDDVSVWHGTDLDLRGRLEEEKLRQQGGFETVSYLSEHHPAETWKPTNHNVANDVRRYFKGLYANAHDLLKMGSEHPLFELEAGEDGRIIYALPSGPQEIADLERLATRDLPKDPRIGVVLVVPTAPLPIAEVALEAACLERLKDDAELIGQDPFALPEIQHMADAAHESLRRQLARLTRPSPDARWYSGRKALQASRDAALRARLSEIADDRFPETPRIVNELIVRKTLSRPMVNARKKVLLGILERTGELSLGFSDTATTPDASTYRTVIERPGLYVHVPPHGRWAEPSEIPDPGLRAVWAHLEDFFSEPAASKDPGTLITDLQTPPYGLRFGVIPLLFAAGLKAFGRAIAIRKGGAYLHDVLASEIEDICARPDRYEVEVLSFDEDRDHGLSRLIEIFGTERAGRETDRLRYAWDALQAWKNQLPPAALRSRQVGPAARMFQAALRDASDPAELFFRTIPRIADTDTLDQAALDTVDVARRELEDIVVGYQSAAVEAVRETLSLGRETGNALDGAEVWAACFPDAALPQNGLDGPQRALLQQARHAGSGRHTEASFARALSTVLIGRDFHQWDDRTPRQFAGRLRETAERIESAALEAEAPDPRLRPLVESRLRDLIDTLQKMADTADVNTLMRELDEYATHDMKTERGDGEYGKPKRRAS